MHAVGSVVGADVDAEVAFVVVFGLGVGDPDAVDNNRRRRP